MISVIVPLYNEEGTVGPLHEALKKELDAMREPYEILFIDDGSTDGTFEKMKGLKPLRAIRFPRNFGQTSAMDAGFGAAAGELIVTMDGDLQNDPADIPKLISKIREGHDIVSGWRAERKDPMSRKVLSAFANWLTRKMTGLALRDHACSFRPISTRAAPPWPKSKCATTPARRATPNIPR